MKAVSRLGIGMSPVGAERLRNITDKFSVSQSRLITAFVTVTTDKDIEDILERYDRLEAIEAELQQYANQNLINFIRGKTVEELESMLGAAKAAP